MFVFINFGCYIASKSVAFLYFYVGTERTSISCRGKGNASFISHNHFFFFFSVISKFQITVSENVTIISYRIIRVKGELNF